MGQSKRKRLWLVGGVTAVVIALVAGLVLFVFPQVRTPQQLAAEAAPPPPSLITAVVKRRALSAKVVMRATVAPGPAFDLKPSDALATAGMVVTSIPAASATTLVSGTVVVEANGEPLIAMNWPFPAYRDIRAGDAGPDVVQLQKTLARLGYATGGTGIFDASTRKGLKQLYSDRGYKAPAGPASSGQGTGQGSASGDRGGSSSAASIGSNEVYLAARQVLVVPKPSSAVTMIPIKVGERITAETVLAKLDGQASAVVASTTPERASKVKAGAIGRLTSAGGEQYEVKVTAVASAVAEVSGLGQGVKIDLAFGDSARAAPVSAEGATSRLEISTGSTVEGLVVPVTAIYSMEDGSSYVVPRSDVNQRIAVTVGANIDGSVEIKPGSELKEGDVVVLGTMPSR